MSSPMCNKSERRGECCRKPVACKLVAYAWLCLLGCRYAIVGLEQASRSQSLATVKFPDKVSQSSDAHYGWSSRNFKHV